MPSTTLPKCLLAAALLGLAATVHAQTQDCADLNISDQASYQAAQACTTASSLKISGARIDNFTLPALRTVTGTVSICEASPACQADPSQPFCCAVGGLGNASFPALAQIGGDLTITYLARTQSISFPVLSRVNATFVNFGSLSAPAIISGNGLTVLGNAALQILDLPVLTSLGSATCPAANQTNSTCPRINVSQNRALLGVALGISALPVPALLTADDIAANRTAASSGVTFVNNTAITDISLVNLTALIGSNPLQVSGNPVLTNLDLTALQNVSGLIVDANKELAQLSLPNLAAIGGRFVVGNTPLAATNCTGPPSTNPSQIYFARLQVNTPVLASIGSGLDVTWNVDQVSAPLLNLTNAAVRGNSSDGEVSVTCTLTLSGVSFPALKNVSSIRVANNSALAIFQAPQLATVGGQPAGNAPQGAISFTNNPQLGQSQIQLGAAGQPAST